MNEFVTIDTMPPWSMAHKKCPVCHNIALHFVGNISGKHACRECFQEYLETQLIRSNIQEWPWERFSLALSSLGAMQDRLLALIHFRQFQGVESVPGLLAENLGFESSHPLSQYARQKAYEACVFFTDRHKMLDIIVTTTKYSSWQQKANMVMVAYDIDPHHPKVQEFINHMGHDPSPNVRSHVAEILREDKTSWAKTLFQKLARDVNPLVRQACQMTDKTQGRLNPGKIKSGKINPAKALKPSYTRHETIILNNLNFELQEEIYEQYLGHLPGLLNKKKYSELEIATLKINTKDACVRLLAAALENEVLFHTILEKLPRPALLLLHILVFEYEQYHLPMVEQKLLQIMEMDPSEPVSFRPLEKAVNQDPAYFMFKLVRDWTYYTNDLDHIAIIPGLAPFIKDLMPMPKLGSPLPLVDIQDRVEQIHGDHQAIFRQLPIILSFIAQGNLKLSKNGNKILAGSLKKMAMVCQINEFYGTETKELSYLKTKLLGEFFNCIPPWKPEALKDLPGFIKNTLSHYFSFSALKSHRGRDFFDHINRQMKDYDSNTHEKEMRDDFKALLQQLPQDRWISIFQLARQAFYESMEFNPFLDWYEFKNLYFTTSRGSKYRFQDKKFVSTCSVFDLLTLPFVKAMMFLMGALGVVDLGYSAPENILYRKYGNPWLTVFDGLKYVRLTEFGAYVLGEKKSFSIDLPVQTARIEVDEYKTMVSLFGDDPIKKMALDSLGQEINRSSYMVTYESFLRECHTSGDVKNKIKFFRDNIVETPPPIWENFFKAVLARMEPLELVPAMVVFRVKPDRELLSLLTTDPVLKKMVIRAENFHLVVRSGEVAKLKKRLAVLGFFAS